VKRGTAQSKRNGRRRTPDRNIPTWREQHAILLKARQLQAKLGPKQHDDMNGYDDVLAATGLKLDPTEKKQITAAVSWKNPAAAKVIKKIPKSGRAPWGLPVTGYDTKELERRASPLE